jgi:hypothetical protein
VDCPRSRRRIAVKVTSRPRVLDARLSPVRTSIRLPRTSTQLRNPPTYLVLLTIKISVPKLYLRTSCIPSPQCYRRSWCYGSKHENSNRARGALRISALVAVSCTVPGISRHSSLATRHLLFNLRFRD